MLVPVPREAQMSESDEVSQDAPDSEGEFARKRIQELRRSLAPMPPRKRMLS